jgi:hypothetical protein
MDCFICFEECKEKCPCACNQCVHPRCLALWQFRQAGKKHEKYCSVCEKRFPDWRYVLYPQYRECFSLNVTLRFSFGWHIFQVPISGHMSKRNFYALLSVIVEDMEERFSKRKDITFICEVPESDEILHFRGIHGYSAALFCARMKSLEKTKTNQPVPKGVFGKIIHRLIGRSHLHNKPILGWLSKEGDVPSRTY